MINNLGYKGGKEVQNLDSAKCELVNNYFDLGLAATDADFASLDESQLTLPRKKDGTLPNISFMKLNAAGRFLDKGAMTGFPFKGKAPDLGAFEFDGGSN